MGQTITWARAMQQPKSAKVLCFFLSRKNFFLKKEAKTFTIWSARKGPQGAASLQIKPSL
jgi:hypothetical protein